MAKIHFDFVVLETFQRLFGAGALLDLLDKAMPEMEWQESQALKQLAEGQGWEYGDYDAERQVVDAKFQYWVPRFAAYSLIILLDSIVETQLYAYAERVGRDRGSTFRPKDIKGRGLEPAALYLKRVAGLDVKTDAAWNDLDQLQALRNIIVHRGGKRGESPEQQKEVDRLVQTYPGKLSIQESPHAFTGEMEIWISMHLCRHFAQETEAFFKRLSKATGLPEKGVWVES